MHAKVFCMQHASDVSRIYHNDELSFFSSTITSLASRNIGDGRHKACPLLSSSNKHELIDETLLFYINFVSCRYSKAKELRVILVRLLQRLFQTYHRMTFYKRLAKWHTSYVMGPLFALFRDLVSRPSPYGGKLKDSKGKLLYYSVSVICQMLLRYGYAATLFKAVSSCHETIGIIILIIHLLLCSDQRENNTLGYPYVNSVP